MDKLDGKSLDLEKLNIEKLKELFPQVVTEGKIDFDKLRLILGDEVEEEIEKYQFTWNGKSRSIKLAQTPSTGTLIPVKDESKNWDNTENLYIEGDNLEVLKLLQKTYYGKIKLIYIDPPYNTGGDFVYKDDFKDSIKNYKEQTNQTTRANPETSGRFHTDWLNMMYSRLILARNLLSNDGIIFISIDENEVHNLRKICDEIYGEINLLGQLSVVNNLKGRSDDKFFATCNEFMLVYGKNRTMCTLSGFLLEEEELDEDYTYKDEIGNYKLIGLRKTGKSWERVHRPYMYYPILYKDDKFYSITEEEYKNIYNEKTKKFDDKHVEELKLKYENSGYNFFLPHDSKGAKGRWRWGIDTFLREKDINVELNSSNTVCSKMRATIEDGSLRMKSAKSLWYKPEYDTGNGSKILKKLFANDITIFDNPKSLTFIKDVISISTDKEAIILDFFSGSATTAHAVMQLNAEDSGNRKFIMVQLPELVDESSEAYKAGYKNICEIGKERIRRAGETIKQELIDKKSKAVMKDENIIETEKFDNGFKVFKLESTNIIPWDGTAKLDESTLFTHLEVIKENRTSYDVLYEIMLKYGVFDKPVEEVMINGKTMFSIAMGYLIVCLEDNITMSDVLEIGKHNPKNVIFKESGFSNDNDKINATYTLEKLGVEEIKSI